MTIDQKEVLYQTLFVPNSKTPCNLIQDSGPAQQKQHGRRHLTMKTHKKGCISVTQSIGIKTQSKQRPVD